MFSFCLNDCFGIIIHLMLYYVLCIRTIEFRKRSRVVDMQGGLHERILIDYDFIVVPREYYASIVVFLHFLE
jgi:hypothetical protein